MIKLDLPRRNTKSCWIEAFGVRILFSYETPVAFDYFPVGRFRRENCWGPTTGRHMKEQGVTGYAAMDQEMFEAKLQLALVHGIAQDEFTSKEVTSLRNHRRVVKVTKELVPEFEHA